MYRDCCCGGGGGLRVSVVGGGGAVFRRSTSRDNCDRERFWRGVCFGGADGRGRSPFCDQLVLRKVLDSFHGSSSSSLDTPPAPASFSWPMRSATSRAAAPVGAAGGGCGGVGNWYPPTPSRGAARPPKLPAPAYTFSALFVAAAPVAARGVGDVGRGAYDAAGAGDGEGVSSLLVPRRPSSLLLLRNRLDEARDARGGRERLSFSMLFRNDASSRVTLSSYGLVLSYAMSGPTEKEEDAPKEGEEDPKEGEEDPKEEDTSLFRRILCSTLLCMLRMPRPPPPPLPPPPGGGGGLPSTRNPRRPASSLAKRKDASSSSSPS